jgi:hypothetical protein
MPGRTLPEAYEAFIDPIRSALGLLGAMKVTQSRGAWHDSGGEHSWTINGGEGHALGRGLALHAAMMFTYRQDPNIGNGPWRVSTRAYEYKITMSGSEILVWHWQPASRGPKYPHLHVGSAALGDRSPLDAKHHVPTSRVAIEQVVRMIIGEFEAVPGRADWSEQLDDYETRFRTYSSWGSNPSPSLASTRRLSRGR